jgi:hypothetical protein
MKKQKDPYYKVVIAVMVMALIAIVVHVATVLKQLN